MKLSLRSFVFVTLFTLISIAIAACSGFERHERTIWYVSTTGNDDNSCTEPDLACLTVRAAYTRADADDQIVIAAGTYNETGRHEDSYFAEHLDFVLEIRGAGPDETIIDLGNTYAGFYIDPDGRLRLEGLTVQNARGNSPGGCILVGGGQADLEDVRLTRCLYAGIVSDAGSVVNLVDVSITEAIVRDPFGVGSGIISRGSLSIQGGDISRNSRTGISSHGNLIMDGTLIEGNLHEGLNITGEATLSNLTVQNNAGTMGHFDGITIYGEATVSLASSLITANNSRGIRIYGADAFNPPVDGIPSAGPAVTISDTTIRDHAADGVYVTAGTVTLNNVTIQNNGSVGGRALQNTEGLVELRNSRITGNLTGGIHNGPDAEMNVYESVIDENSGTYPAIYSEGSMNIQNSLVANNSAATGRAVENVNGDMLIANSTISGNQRTAFVVMGGNTTLSYVTIADNEGAGIVASNAEEIRLNLFNTLLARNELGNCNFINPDAPDVLLTGTNISTETSCTFPLVVPDAELLLAELADNGGPTFSQALLPGSPALDAATGACTEVDQRLFTRPIGPACDVGAYEAGGTAMSLEATPTADVPTLIVITESGCFYGPGLEWPRYSNLPVGTQAQIVGQGFGGGWMVIKHPTINANCWIDIDDVEFDTPLEEMRLIAIPPKPTPTPSATPEDREKEPTACPTQINAPGVCQ